MEALRNFGLSIASRTYFARLFLAEIRVYSTIQVAPDTVRCMAGFFNLAGMAPASGEVCKRLFPGKTVFQPETGKLAF